MDFETLSQWLIDYAASYPEEYNQINIWPKPMMACAKADIRFLRLREIAVPDHALPQDLLPGARSVVVWFIPFKHHIQMDNTGGERPSLSWGRAYNTTNDMINRASRAMKTMIEDAGGKAALTPAT